MAVMNKGLIIWSIILFGAVTAASYWWFIVNKAEESMILSPIARVVEKPVEKYSFNRLATSEYKGSQIVIDEVLEEDEDFVVSKFWYEVEGKIITGQLNTPTRVASASGYPVVIMLRGYINPETYTTGDGTRNAAAYFARNGFVTVAPDFLGYGGSDEEDADSMASRMKRPVAVLELVASLNRIAGVDEGRVFMWGHSNGGQIALSVLEIMGRSQQFAGLVVPATLWAPVSKPFPYSILYYTDEYEDGGKALRKVLADFEKDYDVDLYSIHQYYDWIRSPIQVHQGTGDDAIPLVWSDELVERLEELEKEVIYFTYPGADHDMRPVWDTVVERDVEFFLRFNRS